MLVLVLIEMVLISKASWSPDYGDALSKTILFFEGQRSGKLPPTQRMTWRKDSALRDGFQMNVSPFRNLCLNIIISFENIKLTKI